MSKLYRSMLWSGLLVAGVAACGDDVTVTPPEPTVRSISVAPNGVTVGVGVTIPFSAAVNADAGVTNLAVTWSTSDASKATVNPQTGVVTTVAAGSVAVIACSVLVPSVCGNATLTIATTAPTVTGVTVVPAAPFINRGGSVTLVASVQGTNAPAQTVTWVSANPAAVSVGANTGVVTAAANAPAGTVAITACSTVAGFTNVCGSSAVTVVIPDPAQILLEGLSYTDPVLGEVPVVLNNVNGQIQFNLQINTGAQQISRVDALIGGIVVASQSFAVQPAAVKVEGEDANVVIPVTLSTNTTQLRKNGSLFLPVVFNGNQGAVAHLYVVGATLPVASNAIPVVMNNPDAAAKVGAALTLVNNSANPSYFDGVNTWFTGSQSVGAVNYISFSTIAPSTVPFGGTTCGTTNSTQVTGTPTTGLSIGGTYNCSGVEGGNSTTGVNFGGIAYPTATGPDGTPIVAATGFANVGTAFCVPKAGNPTFTNLPPNCDANSDQRWNMIMPGTAPTNPAAVFVDNKAPTITLKTIAFNVNFDQWWINGGYAFNAANVVATTSEAGTGVASTSVFAQATGAIACGTATPVASGADLAETVTSTVDAWKICARQTDNIGNVGGLAGFSNLFGVDKVAPSARFVTGTLPAPAGTISTVSSVANTTIYSIASPLPAGHIFAIEGNDDRSGFDQGLAVAQFPVNMQHSYFGVGVNTTCPVASYGLPTVLADAWVRSIEQTINCSAIPQYNSWSSFVTDRAGNSSSTIARNYAKDDLAVADITNMGFAQLLYAPGTSAGFNIFATDDLEVIEGTLLVMYDDNNDLTREFAVRYPYSLFPLGVRWDATLTNTISGTPLTLASLVGRFDTTLTATNLPDPVAGNYASRQNALPDSVYANVRDVASQPDATPLVVALNSVTQFSDSTAQPWTGAPAAVFGDVNSLWTGSTVGPNKLAVQRTGTSITVPYFDSVNLYGVIGGELVFCATYGAPVSSDNGVFRTWQYTMTTPAGSNACAGAGAWRVGGVKGNSILLSQQF